MIFALCPISLRSWQTRSFIHTRSFTFRPSYVPDIAEGALSPQKFRSLVASQTPTPFKLSQSCTKLSSVSSVSRSEKLLNVLRKEKDRVVDIEVGRYDELNHAWGGSGFNSVTVGLAQYLNWLGESVGGEGKVSGSQIYLAQWRAEQDIPEVRDLLRTPAVLQPYLEDGSADLYQRSFFIGPRGAVTPLHYDPYENLFHLQATSSPYLAKHLLLLPPNVSEFVRPGDGRLVQKNTSRARFTLRLGVLERGSEFEMSVNHDTTPQSLEAISEQATACLLKEGETLFIPRGWWHQVENVWIGDSEMGHEKKHKTGWTAGVGWWFRLNSSGCGT